MTKGIIRALVKLGSESGLRRTDKATVYRELDAMNVAKEASWAILRGDRVRLDWELGTSGTRNCLVTMADQPGSFSERAIGSVFSSDCIDTPCCCGGSCST